MSLEITESTTEQQAGIRAALGVPQLSNFPRVSLPRWFQGDLAAKKICCIGDSTTLDTSQGFMTRAAYFGAKIHRPFQGSAKLSRVGDTVTSTAAIVFSGDVGAKIVFASGEESVIASVQTATSFKTVDSGSIAETNGYILRNYDLSVVNEDGPLEGVTIYHCGDNGQSAQGFIAGGGIYPLSYVVSLQSDLYIVSYGINDVRLGLTTLEVLKSRIRTIVETILAAVPAAEILLRIPNTLLTSDSGSYIAPPSSAQAYSDILADAYRSFEGEWARVTVWDTRKTVWGGDLCLATSGLMTDALHPNSTGQSAVCDDLVSIIGRAKKAQTAQMVAATGSTPWVTYPAVLEDSSRFDLVTAGRTSAFGSGYIDYRPSDRSYIYNVSVGDIFWQEGAPPFVLTANGSNNGGLLGPTRISMNSPVALKTGQRARIFRQRGNGDEEVLFRLQQPMTHRFAVPVYIQAAGIGYIDLNVRTHVDPRLLNLINSSDSIVVAGIAPMALTGFSFSSQNADGSGYLRMSKAGDYSSYVGKSGLVYGDEARYPNSSLVIPGRPRNGQTWYDATLQRLRLRQNAITRTVAVEGEGAVVGIRTVTASTTITSADSTILCDATAGAILASLPAASAVPGAMFRIKKIDASGNAVTYSENVDGASLSTAVQWEVLTVQSNGSAYYRL